VKGCGSGQEVIEAHIVSNKKKYEASSSVKEQVNNINKKNSFNS
jgi:hypothetical protein